MPANTGISGGGRGGACYRPLSPPFSRYDTFCAAANSLVREQQLITAALQRSFAWRSFWSLATAAVIGALNANIMLAAEFDWYVAIPTSILLSAVWATVVQKWIAAEDERSRWVGFVRLIVACLLACLLIMSGFRIYYQGWDDLAAWGWALFVLLLDIGATVALAYSAHSARAECVSAVRHLQRTQELSQRVVLRTDDPDQAVIDTIMDVLAEIQESRRQAYRSQNPGEAEPLLEELVTWSRQIWATFSLATNLRAIAAVERFAQQETERAATVALLNSPDNLNDHSPSNNPALRFGLPSHSSDLRFGG